MEWNGRYRDSVRRFVRGDPGLVPEVATRLAGSSDLYEANLRQPINSINFVTCHDGFTLWDLVSYNAQAQRGQPRGQPRRHQRQPELELRGGGRDHGRRRSWPCAAARPRTCMAILFLSQGIPMLLAGDEVLRSQGGNNNAWCQDNPLGWFDWSLVETNGEMLRFVRGLIALRKRHPSLRRRRFLAGAPRNGAELPDIAWHGTRLASPPGRTREARTLAFTLAPARQDEDPLYIAINMESGAQRFELPRHPDLAWYAALDTGGRLARGPGRRPDDQLPLTQDAAGGALRAAWWCWRGAERDRQLRPRRPGRAVDPAAGPAS